MKKEFNFTYDGSVGLYNNDVDDVYHSVFGAKSEAEEKFIKPLDFMKNFYNKNEIKVLDICFGIGYNTKAFLKKIIETKYSGKIYLDILEYDKNLVTLSPFVKDGYFETYPQISYILSTLLIEQIYEDRGHIENIINIENKKYFEPFYSDLIKKYKKLGYTYNLERKNNSFLHNIYYHCISTRHKMRYKAPKIKNISFRAYIDDARNTIKTLEGLYDIVFLDAFTPAKLPTLWSLEFFNELYRICSNDSLLITYSNSSAVRHAMTDAGFSVGKLFDKDNRPSGTIASKNKDMIKNKLNDYDLGLMKTNAGIYYRDKNLNASSEEILFEHEERKKNSNLESSSHYIKTHKKERKNASK